MSRVNSDPAVVPDASIIRVMRSRILERPLSHAAASALTSRRRSEAGSLNNLSDGAPAEHRALSTRCWERSDYPRNIQCRYRSSMRSSNMRLALAVYWEYNPLTMSINVSSQPTRERDYLSSSFSKLPSSFSDTTSSTAARCSSIR